MLERSRRTEMDRAGIRRSRSLRALGAMIALMVLVGCAMSMPAQRDDGPGQRADNRGVRGQRPGGMGARRGASADAGTRNTLVVGGQTRTYYFYRPAGASADPIPLVIVLHGGFGDAGKIAAQTGFRAVADRNGFAVAFPESTGHWNDGRESVKQYGDDTGFMSALINELVEKEGIDRARVYATGPSNGGMMTMRLACERANEIAAFAVVVASFADNTMARCKPGRPLPILIIHGSADPAVRAEGIVLKPSGKRPGGTITPMADTLEFWRNNNGCQPRPTTKDLPNTSNDGTNIEVTEYQGCRPGAAVRYMEIVGGGHTWPGSPVPPESGKVGRVTKDVDGSQYIWDFFREYQLPQ